MQTYRPWLGFFIVPFLWINIAAAHAQEAKVEKAVSPDDFYRSALQDKAAIASFGAVAKGLQEKSVILIDLRSEQEFNESHIEGAISVPATELTTEVLEKAVPHKDAKLVLYCANNLNPFSRMVALTTLAYPTIKQLGYTNVQVLETFWQKSGDSGFSLVKTDFPLPMSGRNRTGSTAAGAK